jgi:hypothetical protein
MDGADIRLIYGVRRAGVQFGRFADDGGRSQGDSCDVARDMPFGQFET